MCEDFKWTSGEEMTAIEKCAVILLRDAGCKCDLPLLGASPVHEILIGDPRNFPMFNKPRCRTCNVQSPVMMSGKFWV